MPYNKAKSINCIQSSTSRMLYTGSPFAVGADAWRLHQKLKEQSIPICRCEVGGSCVIIRRVPNCVTSGPRANAIRSNFHRLFVSPISQTRRITMRNQMETKILRNPSKLTSESAYETSWGCVPTRRKEELWYESEQGQA